MHHADGSFWGYREKPKVLVGGGRLWLFPPIDPQIRLNYWHWDLLGPVPFQYRVFSGLANDNYPNDFIEFGFMSRLIFCTIRENPGTLILTYDGVTEQPEREFTLSFIRLEACVGFKIKNAQPGFPCNYQIIPML